MPFITHAFHCKDLDLEEFLTRYDVTPHEELFELLPLSDIY